MQAAEFGAFVQADQGHALGGAAHFTDFTDAGAYQHTFVGDQHDFVFRLDQGGSHDLAVALTLLDGDHALGAPAMAGVFTDAGAFAIAVFRGGQHAVRKDGERCKCGVSAFYRGCAGGVSFSDQHGDHALAFLQHHAAHATGVTAHGAHVVFIKAHGFAAITEQHHVMFAIGQGCANQEIAWIEVHGDDAGLTRVGKLVKRGLLDRAHAGGHEDVLVIREFACRAGQCQHHVDFFTLLQREHVDDGTSA